MSEKAKSIIQEYKIGGLNAGKVAALEKKLQDAILAYLHKEKIWCKRTQMGMDSGLPDIYCIINGYYVGIEVKRPDGTGRATLQQKKVIADIRKAGGIAACVAGLQDVEALVWIARNKPFETESSKKKKDELWARFFAEEDTLE